MGRGGSDDEDDNDDDNDSEGGEEGEERRIRERMKRAMTDMNGGGDEDLNDKDDRRINQRITINYSSTIHIC